MGWQALEQWGDDVVRGEPLAGGAGVNQVRTVRINGERAVARLGNRSDADLAWEMNLLRHLDRHGVAVPVPIPTPDGRWFVQGLVVMSYVAGEPPQSTADWRRVAATLRQLHQLSQGCPNAPAGNRPPTYYAPKPGPESTFTSCRLRPSFAAERRGHVRPANPPASSTATLTRATSA